MNITILFLLNIFKYLTNVTEIVDNIITVTLPQHKINIALNNLEKWILQK